MSRDTTDAGSGAKEEDKVTNYFIGLPYEIVGGRGRRGDGGLSEGATAREGSEKGQRR